MDYEMPEDRLKKQAVRIGIIDHAEKEAKTRYLSSRTTDNKELWNRVLDQQFVTLEAASRACQEARRESVEIDEDCVTWWQEKYQRLLNEFNELFGELVTEGIKDVLENTVEKQKEVK